MAREVNSAASESWDFTRVKVYKMGDDGSWLERGMGHITLEYLEKPRAMGLLVLSNDEEQPKTLLMHKIVASTVYTRSEESTIITWQDDELNADIALSFAEEKGCVHIWEQIQRVQEEVKRGDDSELASDLPMPDLNNLDALFKIVSTAPVFQREQLAQALMRPNWIASLLDLFKQCEDLENSEGLATLYRLMRAIIMLNDASVLEELLKEEYVMDVVGSLEYDPDLKQTQKHRAFLTTAVTFKEVVPIKDPSTLAKIHQTYRIQYIKDVVLPRALDDATYATLSSLVMFNNMEVVNGLAQDPHFLPQLFTALQAADPSSQEWADLVAFLQEFCNLARHVPPTTKGPLLNKLVHLGLYEQVTRIMKVGSEPVKLRATDVLLAVMQHDVDSLRLFLREQKDNMLFSLLVREFAESPADGGLAEQICELLKLLLDAETLGCPVEKSDFVQLFYEKFMARILTAIHKDKAVNIKEGTRVVPAHTLGLLVDFMCFCVQHHATHVKYFTLRNDMVRRVLNVIHRNERWLACAAVRFLRTCVTIKEAFWSRYLVKHNVFEPVMAAFAMNGERYNLLNSAVLELLDHIRKENMKELIEYLVKSFYHRFEDVDYVDTFKALRLKHEQHMDGLAEGLGNGGDGAPDGPPGVSDSSKSGPRGTPGGSRQAGEDGDAAGVPLKGRTFSFSAATGEPLGMSGGHAAGLAQLRRRRDARGLDRDEEDYFDTEDDDEAEDAAPSPSSTAGSSSPAPGAPPAQAAAAVGPGSSAAASPSISANLGKRPSGAFSARHAEAGPGPGSQAAGPAAAGGTGSGARDDAQAAPGGSGSRQAATDNSSQGSPGAVWLGLAEYEDVDEAEAAALPQGSGSHGTALAGSSPAASAPATGEQSSDQGPPHASNSWQHSAHQPRVEGGDVTQSDRGAEEPSAAQPSSAADARKRPKASPDDSPGRLMQAQQPVS